MLRSTENRQETSGFAFLPEQLFLKALCLERRRAERSRKPLLLVLIQHPDAPSQAFAQFRQSILKVQIQLSGEIRATDICGWYKDRAICGIVFTELNGAPRGLVLDKLSSKINRILSEVFRSDDLSHIRVSFHFFPEDPPNNVNALLRDLSFYPDLAEREDSGKLPRLVKRFIDLAASFILLILLSPVFALIVIAIKSTSRGPALFKQTRVGQYGKCFVFLKFRSMSAQSDSGIHEDYIKRLVAGGEGIKQSAADGKEAFKITQDPRVTTVGRFLRKTSLDELPQFWNVLKGEMSLVGPRPPIPYEVQVYDPWHMRRVCEAKPGMTGLWQVMGRSRTTFDDMVRLDLHYARTWSLSLDMKILLQTPRAVISGEGAY